MRCTSHALLQCDSFLWIFAVFSQASGPCTRDVLTTDTLALTDTCRCDAGHKTWAISSVAVAVRNTMSTARRRSPLVGTCLCRRLFTAIAGATVRTQPDQGRPFGIVQSATGLTCVAPPCLRARCVCVVHFCSHQHASAAYVTVAVTTFLFQTTTATLTRVLSSAAHFARQNRCRRSPWFLRALCRGLPTR